MSAYNQAHGLDLRSRISSAIAAAALVQLVQSSFAFNDASLPAEVFVGHALVVVGFQLIAAIALGSAGWCRLQCLLGSGY